MVHQPSLDKIEAAKAAPPFTISAATIAGVPVADIVLWATLIYTLMLITQKLYQFWKLFKKDPK
jgi:hypothetical protein